MASAVSAGLTIDRLLLQRHNIIDHLLTNAIESGKVNQVIEVAAGLSARGVRIAKRYRDRGLIYVEGDLPAMAKLKRQLLESAGLRASTHHIVDVNALHELGPLSPAEAATPHLRANTGTAIITEGLLNYFDRRAVQNMWSHFAGFLRSFSGGIYLSDLHLESDTPNIAAARWFKRGLELFARGKTHLHFWDEGETVSALKKEGFDNVTLYRPQQFAQELDIPVGKHPDVIRIVEAAVR